MFFSALTAHSPFVWSLQNWELTTSSLLVFPAGEPAGSRGRGRDCLMRFTKFSPKTSYELLQPTLNFTLNFFFIWNSITNIMFMVSFHTLLNIFTKSVIILTFYIWIRTLSLSWFLRIYLLYLKKILRTLLILHVLIMSFLILYFSFRFYSFWLRRHIMKHFIL